MKKITEFDIIPVLELNASEFTQNEYETPNGSRYEFPEGWNQYWIKSLSDSGIKHIQSIELGYNLVQLSTISNCDLRIIVETQLKETSADNIDEIPSFEGGLAIRSNNEMLVTPQCCTALYNYLGWQEIIMNPEEAWNMIWVGHPWIFGRVQAEQLQITDYVELNKEQINDSHSTYSFDLSLFKEKIQAAIQEINEFKERVTIILSERGLGTAAQVANALIEGVK